MCVEKQGVGNREWGVVGAGTPSGVLEVKSRIGVWVDALLVGA